MACTTLGDSFGHLASDADWSSLLCRLVECCKLDQAFLDGVPKNDMINVTILLFQSLCPIRFAFLDGQARVVSTAFYLRKMFPTGLTSPDLVKPLNIVIEELRAKNINDVIDFSVSKTGIGARCLINLPTNVDPTKDFETKHLNKMFNISKKLLDTLSQTVPRNLSDAIVYVIRMYDLEVVRGKTRNTVSFAYEHVINHLALYDSAIAARLFSEVPDRQSLASTNDLLPQLAKQIRVKTVFPNFKSDLFLWNSEAVTLMYTIGPLLVGLKHGITLENCMNREWKVPILKKDQIRGINNIDGLHKHTYVGSPNSTALFEKLYYRVSFGYVCTVRLSSILKLTNSFVNYML